MMDPCPASVTAARRTQLGREPRRLSPRPHVVQRSCGLLSPPENGRRTFARPSMAADHAMRLARRRPLLSVQRCRQPLDRRDPRAASGRLHALRNVCIAVAGSFRWLRCREEGSAERLMCPCHRFAEYALDGRAGRADLSCADRPVTAADDGLSDSASATVCFSSLPRPVRRPTKASPAPSPTWLADGKVTRRECHNTTWNWKYMLNFVGSLRAGSVFRRTPTEAGEHDRCFEFGPLSRIMVNSERAVLVRVIPKFAERTDLQVIEITSGDAPAEAASPRRRSTPWRTRSAAPAHPPRPSWNESFSAGTGR